MLLWWRITEMQAGDGVGCGREKEKGWLMDYWNLVWLVVMLGLAVVAPMILLVVAARAGRRYVEREAAACRGEGAARGGYRASRGGVGGA